MKKKLLSIIIMSSVTISYANSYFAFIYNKPTTKYETTEQMVGGELPPLPDGGEGEGEGVVTNPIKSLKCIWNACIGSYETGQMFYIDGRNAPTVFQELSGFDNTTRAFGSKNALFAENNGTLYGMLNNDYGQLGVNDLATKISSPKETVGLSGSLIDVKAANISTVIQTTQGLYFAGYNDAYSNSLFNKSIEKGGKNYTFKEAVLSTTIDDFDFNYSGLVYSDSGKLFVLGSNVSGRFGLGDSAPSIITDYTEVPGLSNVKDVHIAGDAGTGQVAILKDGTIWVSGSKLDKIGLSTGLTSSRTFVDTGFAVNELNMFSRSSTTYLIKNNKLYYSGTDPVSNTTSSDFKLLQSASYFDVKSFINSSGELAMLTTDGRILSLLFDGGYYFDYIDSPNFSS